jgi:hypothetical protein
MKIRVESSHKADEVPGRPEKVQPHCREIRSYSRVYGQLVPVREGEPSRTAPSFSPALACDQLLHVSRTYPCNTGTLKLTVPSTRILPLTKNRLRVPPVKLGATMAPLNFNLAPLSFSLIDRFALFLEGADAFLVISAAVHDAAQSLDAFKALGRHGTGAGKDPQLLLHD